MLVRISADADVVILVSGDGDVVDGRFSGFRHGAQLGIDQQAGLPGGGGGHQRVADGAVVGLFVVLAAPELDKGQGVLGVFRFEAEGFRFGRHGVNGGLEVRFFGVAQRVESILEVIGIGFIGQHVEEVLADQLGVDAHVQGRHALGDEIPAVVKGGAGGVVEHEHLVQGLQSQRMAVGCFVHARGIFPFHGDEVEQVAGVQHLGLDLVAVLNQRHRIDVLGGLDIGVQGGENGVVLGLAPLDRSGVGRIDGFEHLDEARAGGLAAAGVADAVEGLAVGFFDGLFEEFLVGHGLRLSDDFFDRHFPGERGNAAQGEQHGQSQNDSQCLFHEK